MVQFDHAGVLRRLPGAKLRPRLGIISGPGIAEPDRRHQAHLCLVRTTLDHLDANEDVFWRGFGIFDEDIKITIVVEDARVYQLVLLGGLGAVAVRLYRPRVRAPGRR